MDREAFEVCTAAVQQNADAIQYIREPEMKKRVKEALKKMADNASNSAVGNDAELSNLIQQIVAENKTE